LDEASSNTTDPRDEIAVNQYDPSHLQLLIVTETTLQR
jgi:hypothetical protein